MSEPAEDKAQAFVSLAQARASGYAFLSAAFSQPPSSEKIAVLRTEAFLDWAADIFSEATLAPLRKFTQAPEPVAELVRHLRQQFMGLFKVPGGQYVAPYESVFRDTRDMARQPVNGLLMGQAALDVQKWYRLAALDIAPDFKDLPDHIALELNYLATLCAKEQEFADAGDEAKLTRAQEMERDFLAAHVVTWVGALGDKIKEKTPELYFRALAQMLVEFTTQDLATLEETLGSSQRTSAPHYVTAPD
jgi:TorA maturation chaperone TorD